MARIWSSRLEGAGKDGSCTMRSLGPVLEPVPNRSQGVEGARKDPGWTGPPRLISRESCSVGGKDSPRPQAHHLAGQRLGPQVLGTHSPRSLPGSGALKPGADVKKAGPEVASRGASQRRVAHVVLRCRRAALPCPALQEWLLCLTLVDRMAWLWVWPPTPLGPTSSWQAGRQLGWGPRRRLLPQGGGAEV